MEQLQPLSACSVGLPEGSAMAVLLTNIIVTLASLSAEAFAEEADRLSLPPHTFTS